VVSRLAIPRPGDVVQIKYDPANTENIVLL
jgi:hypothetical protein